MFWSKKYEPRTLDDVTFNKQAANYLKKIRDSPESMHFVLCGQSGSGKRTLIRLFLDEVTYPENIMWINQSCLKTIESRERLYTFIDSKSSNNGKKWLVVENLNKMVVNFSNILFNILSVQDVTVCILETEFNSHISPWCLLINTFRHTTDEMVETGMEILKKENIEFVKDDFVKDIARMSHNSIYTFLFLQKYLHHLHYLFLVAHQVKILFLFHTPYKFLLVFSDVLSTF